jgi:hypothetical protein
MMKRLVCAAAAVLFVVGTAHAGSWIDGKPVDHVFETPHPYGLTDSSVPQLALSETLHHPDASYIQVHFASFELADGDYVIVRSPDGERSWRYEGLGRAGLGRHPDGFWSSQIRGDTAVVELYTQNAQGSHGFIIDKFMRGLSEVEIIDANPGLDPGAICNADNAEWAKCYMDSEPEIYEQAKAVIRLRIPGSGCTGWLIGCEGHMMTNEHCIGSQNQANQVDYEFMAEGATCQTNCASNGACPGTIEATSATLIKTNSALDYTLLKLPGNLSDEYGYMQLREEGPILDERIYIPQHPAVWGKRIAVFSDHSSDTSGFCEIYSLNRPPCSGGPGDIGYYCDTQGGSSGSPVLAYSDHRVVALHHCAYCPNRGLNISDVIGHIGDDLPDCAIDQLAGTIELDRQIYSCSDTIRITVVDDSLQGAENQMVTLMSTTESTPEPVVLSEQEPGVFFGAFATTSAPAASHDGLLSLSHGDRIEAEYIDADDGSGGVNVSRIANADADCAAPVIVDLLVTDITESSATISWETDEVSEGYVTYGEVPPGSSTAADPNVSTTHSVQIDGLTDCTPYFFSVTSTDELGNTGTDDNGGQYHMFTTICFPPSPIPNGKYGTRPVLVERVTPGGDAFLVHWEDMCDPWEANLLYGPLDQISSYTVTGAECTVSQPALWSSLPAGDIWFLMVGESRSNLESSWGWSSYDGERNGFIGSGQCGTTFKNPAGTCP